MTLFEGRTTNEEYFENVLDNLGYNSEHASVLDQYDGDIELVPGDEDIDVKVDEYGFESVDDAVAYIDGDFGREVVSLLSAANKVADSVDSQISEEEVDELEFELVDYTTGYNLLSDRTP